MKTAYWTVTTRSTNIELPNEVEVFYTRKEAVNYLVSITKIAKTYNWKVSKTKDEEGSTIIKYYDGDNLILVSIMKYHKIKIDKI